MSTHNLCFEQKYEKYQSFLSENFQFLKVKFSIYLNRHVFVMLFWISFHFNYLNHFAYFIDVGFSVNKGRTSSWYIMWCFLSST